MALTIRAGIALHTSPSPPLTVMPDKITDRALLDIRLRRINRLVLQINHTPRETGLRKRIRVTHAEDRKLEPIHIVTPVYETQRQRQEPIAALRKQQTSRAIHSRTASSYQ